MVFGAEIGSAVGVTCQGTSSNAVVVTSGKIIGQKARGTVSPDGTVYGTSTDQGVTVITTGRLSGRTGGGTFRQSDGAPDDGRRKAVARLRRRHRNIGNKSLCRTQFDRRRELPSSHG
jgi:hypothetical protein